MRTQYLVCSLISQILNILPRRVFAVWYGFGPLLTLHFTVRFSYNHNYTVPCFCSHMCDAVRFRVWSKPYCTALHFCDHIYDTIYKMRFEICMFFKFWVFPTQPKTNFSLFLGRVLNYWASFSLFWVDFSSQHLIGLLNFFFFGKQRLLNY